MKRMLMYLMVPMLLVSMAVAAQERPYSEGPVVVVTSVCAPWLLHLLHPSCGLARTSGTRTPSASSEHLRMITAAVPRMTGTVSASVACSVRR